MDIKCVATLRSRRDTFFSVSLRRHIFYLEGNLMKTYDVLLKDLIKKVENMIRDLEDFKEEINEECESYTESEKKSKERLNKLLDTELALSWLTNPER